MANFPVAFQGSPITRGVSTGLAIKQRKQEAEQAKLRDQAVQFVTAHNDRLAKLDEQAKQVLEMTQQIAATGGDDEQLKPMRVLYTTLLANRASLEQQFKAAAVQGNAPPEVIETLPDGVQAVQTRMPFFDAAVQIGRGENEQQQVQTLTPEEATEMGFPEGAIVQKKPDGLLSLAFDPSKDLSSLQEKVEALEASGVDHERSLGIAAGRYQISINPITNERAVMDLATGETVGQPLAPAPEGEVPAMIPSDIDPTAALGGPGAVKTAVNVIKGAFNADPASPAAQEATAALTTVREMTSITLQAEVPGRPSNLLLEKLDKLTVSPNSIFQGESQAKTRLEQTHRLIDGEIQRIEIDVLPLELPPDVRVETQLNLTQLKRLRDAYGQLIESFGPAEAPEGIPDEVKELWPFMSPEDRKKFVKDDNG